MSKTVDERVVEMRFDNAKFEQNVHTSMSTLDKLKQKLNLSGSAKGLKEIDAAAKKVDMSGLNKGVETVTAKFSALQVMGVTALANITNSAVNSGKKIVAALTINPVTDGFREYETQMNAVQTILANTQKEGTNVKIVNKALDELNEYADKTIYNFTEMTRNIGTFTAAGVKLDTSVSAIKGIANLAAVSGSNSQQASTAMYQLSQAIASGTVKLMDWNSVVNAGMGGQVFQDALVRTSEHLQTGAKAAIAAEGSFRESLTTGWLTTEVLTQTLDQFATAADTQEEYEAAVKKFVEQGYTQEEAKQMADMARTANDAATKVKTFTQLIDTLKEALGSGWAQTWRLIIGDFEEAKSLWTGVSDVLGGFINNMSEARNKLLESALGKGFTNLSDKISGMLEPAKKVTETIDKTVDTISDLGDIVDKVIDGKFGNGQARFDALTESGVNWCRVQNKVNEKLGDSFRYTEEQIEAQDKLLGKQNKTVEGTKEEAKETGKLTEEKKELIKRIASMTEEQMRSKGYTDEQIEAFKELGETADKLGMPLNEFIDNMDQITGRWLLINSFKNIGQSIISTFKPIGDAWRDTFEPMSPDTLFNIIAAFHKFTMSIKTMATENADNLKRTFKGIFALLDIITTIAGGGAKIAFKVLSTVLGAFNMNVLDFTAILGDLIVKFRDFLFNNDLVNKGFEKLAEGVKMAAEAFKSLYDAFMDLPKVQEFIENIKNIDLTEVGNNIIEGLKNGIKEGIPSIPGILIEIGKTILEAIKGVLGIHSPSTEMHSVGEYAMEGLVNGLKDGAKNVWNTITAIGSKILEWIKNFDWNKAFALGVSVALLTIVKKLVGVLDNLAAPLAGVGNLLSGVGNVLSESAKSIKKILNNTAKVVKSFSKVLKAKAFQTKAEAIRNLAISLAVLAGAVYLLAQLDYGKLWSAIGAITVLSAILIALAIAMDELTSAEASIDKKGFNIKGLRTGLVGIGMALLLIAATVKVMGSMDPEQMKQGFIGLAGLILAIAVVFASFGLLVKGKSAQNIDKAGKMLRKMAFTLLAMVAVVKLVGMLSEEEMKKGAAFVGAFLVFVTALNASSLLAGKNIDRLGKSILKISFAMVLMVGVCKLANSLSPEEMVNGAMFAGGFLAFLAALLAITHVDKNGEMAKLGGLLLSISASMLLMIGVIKLVGLLKPEELIKGLAFATGFLLFVGALVEITKIGKDDQIAKMAGTVLAMSVAIGIMAGVCILLGLINLPALAKGVVAVGILGLIMMGMIKATKGANDVKGNIIAMAVAIAVMAVAVAALSFIDPSQLAGATAALGILMGMFALIAKSSGNLKGSIGTLIVMTIAVGLLAGVIALLSTLPIESILGASASLSLLLMSLSASMSIISKAGTIAPTALISVGIMMLVVAALAGILYLMRDMDPASSIANATALSMLLLSLSTSCVILSAAGLVAPTALIAVGVMTLVVAALAGILYLIRDMNPESSLGNATALSVLLLSLSACCVILGVVGLMGPAALVGVASLVGLIVAVGGLMIAIGALATYFPQLEEFLNRGLPLLEKIGYGLGSFFGNIIAGFSETIAESLPKIASDLSAFMTGIQPFIDGSKQIDESAINGVKNLAAMIALISGASILDAISSWITGESSMEKFATQILTFGDAIVAFSKTVKEGLDEEAVTAAANAGKMMAAVQDAIPEDKWLDGKISIDDFGKKISKFGECLVEYSEEVSEINTESISSSITQAKNLVELAKSMSDIDEDGIDNFGKVKNIGKAIKKYNDQVEDIDTGIVSSSINSAEKLKTLINGLNGIDPSGIDNFKILSIGNKLKSYSDNVSEINASSVSASIRAIQQLIPAINSMASLDASGISTFKSAVDDLATTNINALVKTFSGAADKLKSVGSKMMTGLIDGFKSKQSAFTSIITRVLNSTIKDINGRSSAFRNSGTALSNKFADGLGSGKAKATKNIKSVLGACVSNTKGYYSDFFDAGSYLVGGFASGISSNSYKAAAKAKAMAKAAYYAAKEALDINSPSKIFRKLGYSVPEGFAQGIDRLSNYVENSSISMARTAIAGAEDALAYMSDVINSDSDARPTIRPVIDLSDVKTGVGAISKMFGNSAAIGVQANVNSISNGMMRNRQNGSNDEIVSAIGKLEKSIDGIGKPSYTIEGITYDNGSEISDAIETLISAARRERRI